MKYIKGILIIFTLFFLFSCAYAPPKGIINVPVSREHYQPGLEKSSYAEYQGQIMLFDSISIKAPYVTNFFYSNKDKTIGYTLYYSRKSMQQPVVSFFWYALQKAFTEIGIDIKETGPIKNVPQLYLNIMTLTDQEAKFMLSLSRNGSLILQKEITVSKEFPPTKDVSELKRGHMSL